LESYWVAGMQTRRLATEKRRASLLKRRWETQKQPNLPRAGGNVEPLIYKETLICTQEPDQDVISLMGRRVF